MHDQSSPRFSAVSAQQAELLENRDLIELFDQFPSMGLVLNDARQIIYCNRMVTEQLGLTNIEQAMGRRPGEVMACVHAQESGSCGDSEGCNYCGAVLAVLESQQKKGTIEREARVTVKPADKSLPLDLHVTAKPLKLREQEFTMVIMKDISSQKRREYLEQVFMHDTMLSIDGLSMLTEMASSEGIPDDMRVDIDTIHQQVQLISEEINGHQMLVRAEAGDLKAERRTVDLDPLIAGCVEAVSSLATIAEVNIEYDLFAAPQTITTDPRIFRKVMINALKNAIEACDPEETVTIGAHSSTGSSCTVSIHNPGELSDEIRHQIFQRSFSTKAKCRGLGTYSMRLFMENYLSGNVSFSSSTEKGTTFYLALPA